MIIKGLFHRYERWNPVHPTSGAFWGMGIGLGCGVGWGPGFGPEVIGYVGAGCGVGFSVGITLAGFGIGLPANYVFEVPYKGFLAATSALEFARSSGLHGIDNVAENHWNSMRPHISDIQRRMTKSVYSFKHQDLTEGLDLSGMKDAMYLHSRSLFDNLQKISARLNRSNKGLKD